jgi:hypothetical protein
MQMAWGPWVAECIDMMDGKGTQRHWKYPGAYADQPAVDLLVYRVIRSRWVELVNEKMEAESRR